MFIANGDLGHLMKRNIMELHGLTEEQYERMQRDQRNARRRPPPIRIQPLKEVDEDSDDNSNQEIYEINDYEFDDDDDDDLDEEDEEDSESETETEDETEYDEEEELSETESKTSHSTTKMDKSDHDHDQLTNDDGNVEKRLRKRKPKQRKPLLIEELDKMIVELRQQRFTLINPGMLTESMTRMVPNLRVMEPNDHIISLQTVIRDINSDRSNFVFTADRLIRLVIEEGLNELSFITKSVITPTGVSYSGIEYLKANCGVSIVRSGEVMEKALRDCCRAIRIGKMVIQQDDDGKPHVVFSKLPSDVSLRKVLLLYPIMSTGMTVAKAISVLKKNGVKEGNIILINLFATPIAVRSLANKFNKITIQTVDVHPIVPNHFTKKYFGTD
ncbi:hypothetical protein BLOT_011267 [Blomia tropicalis]|nr:hypothetical protein BLOT_011267 [Blomia tropicalis]